MNRFTVEYDPGEENELLPSYAVVEWTSVNVENGSKLGIRVWKTYNLETGRGEAEELAAVLQEEYNQKLYNELG